VRTLITQAYGFGAFLQPLLALDPVERPSASQHLLHPWIQQQAATLASELPVKRKPLVMTGSPGDLGNDSDDVYDSEAAQVLLESVLRQAARGSEVGA
jgi:serine/threonine protein kinase